MIIIIISTHNQEKTIFNVVAACCKYNPQAEVIVVDNGSTDNTAEVLETLAFHYEFTYLKIRNRKSYELRHGLRG
ncbi:glycosyltransferase [uncultured Draconibacterium sp.]|uniref:glycosyltransferase n=1 Tax=uncultured Draconibacterium sp. TaxID=1573823 RepID=UPI0025CC41B1|nr:glycosyltransferase [uncultured Draconibacterium sp.]